MQKFLADLIIRVFTSDQVQQAIQDILGKLITERILPLVPIVTATAAKAAVDQIVEKIPALEGVVDVVKVGDDARHALNDLIPDIDFGIPPLDAVLDFWRPKNR